MNMTEPGRTEEKQEDGGEEEEQDDVVVKRLGNRQRQAKTGLIAGQNFRKTAQSARTSFMDTIPEQDRKESYSDIDGLGRLEIVNFLYLYKFLTAEGASRSERKSAP